MNKIERYKQMYPTKDGYDELVVESSGKVYMPTWLIRLLIDASGLKSKKSRIIKKVLKRQLQILLENYAE